VCSSQEKLLVYGAIAVIFVVSVRITRLLQSIFDLSECVLNFAFSLFGGSLRLRLFVTGPFPGLAFDSTSDIFGFSLHFVFIHGSLPFACSGRTQRTHHGTYEDYPLYSRPEIRAWL
jgi:hypothetical protein